MKKFVVGYLVTGALLHDYATRYAECKRGSTALDRLREMNPDKDLSEMPGTVAFAGLLSDVMAVVTWPVPLAKAVISVCCKK